MIDSIPAGLWEWFKSCAQITRLFFNFSDDKSGATAISPAGIRCLRTISTGVSAANMRLTSSVFAAVDRA